MRPLPYRVETATGDILDIEFPLHAETESPMRVNQMMTAVLDALDQDKKVCGETANGDVLQALAMAMAVRARMIHAPTSVTANLATHLLTVASDAAGRAERVSPSAGRA